MTGQLQIPDPIHALEIFDLLKRHGIVAALGGSALLAALGLESRVSDWDITTDALPQEVHIALESLNQSFDVTRRERRHPYESLACFAIHPGPVDLIVGFAAREGEVVTSLPTRVTGHWLDMPIGDPVVWLDAYRLLGRTKRVAQLQKWLNTA